MQQYLTAKTTIQQIFNLLTKERIYSGTLWLGAKHLINFSSFNWGRRSNCSNGQHINFVDCSSIFSTDKTLEHWIRGISTTGYQNSGNLWLKSKHFGHYCNLSPSYCWGKRWKKLLQQSTSQICWPFKQTTMGYQNSGKHFGQQCSHSPSYNWD